MFLHTLLPTFDLVSDTISFTFSDCTAVKYELLFLPPSVDELILFVLLVHSAPTKAL